MEEQDHELIERYYRNALDDAELVEFRRRLTGDTAFREAVQLHEDALEAIHLEGTAMLRTRLAAKGRELDAGTDKSGSRRLWWIIVPVVVLLGAWAVWRWMQPEYPPAPSPVIENRDIATSPATDTVPATVPPPEKQSEPAQKTPGHQRVFAAWFRPYKDPSLEPARRGDAEQSPSERFQQLYWDGDYRAALTAFDSLGTSAKNNDNLLFLKTNCLLATGQGAAAGDLLENMLQNDPSRFSIQFGWYLALSRLQTG
ncbi:MAG TPA: hypothetical protein PK228_18610, partial [Saprospiraceae bacterium]|nr:hypothetical protein [Saprospiraceae bacterium]